MKEDNFIHENESSYDKKLDEFENKIPFENLFDNKVPCEECERIQKEKPPLGIMPKSIHDEKRIVNILDALKRYINKGKKSQCMVEWSEELTKLLKERNEVSNNKHRPAPDPDLDDYIRVTKKKY